MVTKKWAVFAQVLQTIQSLDPHVKRETTFVCKMKAAAKKMYIKMKYCQRNLSSEVLLFLLTENRPVELKLVVRIRKFLKSNVELTSVNL